MTDTQKQIAGYIADGCKEGGSLGVELEHFIVRKDGSQVSYYDGISEILNRLSETYTEKGYSGNELISLYNDEASITIEPAGQLEISIAPCTDIDEIDRIYNNFWVTIKPHLDELGFKLVTLGYTPRSKAEDMRLIPKARYEYMDRYFRTSGRYGKNMMRATASTQISIDFSDEADCVRKIRLANLLTPVIYLITDNSPYFEGAPYNGRMLRSKIWGNVDKDRCGTVPGLFKDDFGFASYAEYITQAPAILISGENGPVYTGSEKIEHIYNGKELTDGEIEHILSMFFPDVRLKRYIEIRPADSMPREYVMGYAALIKALFINSSFVLRESVNENSINEAKAELAEKGFDGVIYGIPVRNIINNMFEIAFNVLSKSDAKYLKPLADAALNGHSVREAYREKGIYL